VNRTYYVKIPKQLREAVRRKRPELWPNDWILNHDNAPDNKVLSVEQFLAQKLIAEMKHSSYCPDLTVVDLWLFPKMKTALKGQRFQDIEELS